MLLPKMSTMLTAACCWPSSHSIPAQKFVFGSEELITTVHRCWCWTSTTMCAVTTFLRSLHELDEQSQPGRRMCHLWEASRSTVHFLLTTGYN